jgi:hypothetical protein
VDFDVLQAQVKSLIASLTGLPTDQVIWFDDPAPSIVGSVQALARIQTFAEEQIGQAAESTFAEAVPDDNGPLFESVRTWQAMTLRVRVESMSQAPNQTARFYLGLVREKIQTLTSRFALQGAGLGFQSIAGYTDLSIPVNSGMRSFAALDLRMNAASIWTDPTEYSRIESGQVVKTP